MTTLQILSKLFSPIKHAKRTTFLQALVLSTRPLQGIVSVYMIKKVVESIEQGNTEYFKYNLYIYAGYIVCDRIFQYRSRDRTWVKMPEIYQKIIYNEYIPKYIALDITYSDKKGTGYLMSVIEKGAEQWASMLRNSLRYCIGLLISTLFVIYTFSSLQWWISFGFYVAIIACVCIVIYMTKYIAPMRKIEAEVKNIRSRYLVKIIMSKIEILQSNAIMTEVKKLNSFLDELIFQKSSRSKYVSFIYLIPEFLVSCLKYFVLLVVGYQVLQGQSSVSDLVLMLGAIGVMEYAIEQFTDFYRELQVDIPKIYNLRTIIDNGPSVTLDTGTSFEIRNTGISLQNVTFGYDPDNKIFENFSLDIQAKKKTALVGPSGGGKSTLIKLIAGYLKPDQGEIIVDDQKLSEISLLSYYKHIGYLTQEPSVFDGTIRENLEYGMQTPSPTGYPPYQGKKDSLSGLDTIINLSKCERIYTLPNGLDTEIGERGIRLSGGQKQRLAIAKIMLKNPDIILLDEPTSALDSENEKAVTEALNNLFKNKTVIIIAHRLQTVTHADEIIYIGSRDVLHASSEILERGTHAELLVKQGEYYNMVELQSGF